jgi:hypothetical protein
LDAALPAPSPGHAPPGETPQRSRWGLVLAFLLLGVAIGAAVRATGGDPQRAAEPAVRNSAATNAPPPTPVAASSSPAAAALPSAVPDSDDVPPGEDVPPGYGLLLVTAPSGARVRIDGAIAGAGPIASSVAAPGYHEVRVEQGDRESKHVIEVRAGKITRIISALPP